MNKDYNYYSNSGITYTEAKKILCERIKLQSSSLAIYEGYPERYYSHELDMVANILIPNGVDCLSIDCKKKMFFQYIEKAQYSEAYKKSFGNLFIEKAYEHFIILNFLNLQNGQKYIDLAACDAPLYEIAARLYGVVSYAQDIMFPEGIHGTMIGCDACSLPFEADSIDALSAACSIEHFENDGDIKLFKEVERVLRPGGIFAVAPFYLSKEDCIITDPVRSLDVDFGSNTSIRLIEKWGNRYGRFYSISSFIERIVNSTPKLKFTVYGINKLHEIADNMYCIYVLVASKKE